MADINKRLLIGLASLVALLLACSTLSTLGDGQRSGSVTGLDVNPEDTLFLVGGQPRTLDPATTLSGAGSPIGAIFSGLVALNSDLQVTPDLAAGWDVSEDGTIYTFYIDPDAAFHDGRPVNAGDIVFSWERAANPNTASNTAATYLSDIVGFSDAASGLTERIRGLKVIDDHTLQVQIDAPKPYFLSKLTYPVAFLVDQENVTSPDWQHEPNGTGPFTLEQWRDDEVMVLARSEDSFHAGPNISHVVYFLGAGIPLSMYENDEIDLVGVGGSTLERVQDPNNPLSMELRLGVDMCTTYISFNIQEPPFDDPLVRRAFSLAVERDKLIDGLFAGHSLPAQGFLPPGMPGYSDRLEGSHFDPQEAQALMAEAGFADPAALPDLTYTTSGYGSINGLVTAVITMWQENLGVTVEPVLLDPYTYFDELYGGRTGHIFSSGWCADYPDPENFLDILFHSDSSQNLGGYSSSEVDALLEQARVEPDVDKRLALYQEAEELIVRDTPGVLLAHSLSAELVKPRVHNYHLLPIAVPQWHTVELDPGS